MKPYIKPAPSIVVIFGAGGDLTRRKLIPAMCNLLVDNFLPDKFRIIGTDISAMSDVEWRNHLKSGVETFSDRKPINENMWEEFAKNLNFITGDFTGPAIIEKISQICKKYDGEWQTTSNKIFYFAIPPTLIEKLARQIGSSELAADSQHSRVVVEKPFGRDYQSARDLNKVLTEFFAESQIYRIDHYLGKETVQNILAFRFANSIFEPIWNRRYIDNIQITVAETLGVEHRGSYYEHAGALRDMVQNHLFQLMCLISMEPPASYQADEIRNKKVDVLRAVRKIPGDQVSQFAVRGQYGPGWIDGQHIIAYRQETGVDPNSEIETFAAVKLFIDNWRWEGVPFYLRTGKRLAASISEIIIQFRPVPHQSFPSTAVLQRQPNRFIIRIQPQEGITFSFQAKQPGETMRLRPVDMKFSYKEAFQIRAPEAYETLLLDVMLGDSTQFMRDDQLEIAWSVIQPILAAWEGTPPANFANYRAGSWGPEESTVLIAQDGRTWLSSDIFS